jgi:hypothetical protein
MLFRVLLRIGNFVLSIATTTFYYRSIYMRCAFTLAVHDFPSSSADDGQNRRLSRGRATSILDIAYSPSRVTLLT